MKRMLMALALASVAAQSLGGQQAAKTDLPKIFDKAQYVYVEAESGDVDSRNTTAEDRQAIYNVEKQLRAWGRYMLTMGRDHADLIIRVHKSRVQSNNVPVVVPGGPRQPGRNPFPRDPSDPAGNPQSGPGLGVEAGSPEDELSVYIPGGAGSSVSGPIWNDAAKNGLNPPRLPLFQELKNDVEEAYP